MAEVKSVQHSSIDKTMISECNSVFLGKITEHTDQKVVIATAKSLKCFL